MMRDVIIIGGGAAGLTATLHALDKRLDALLISQAIGGKAGWHRRVVGEHAVSSDTGEAAVNLLIRRMNTWLGHTMRDTVSQVRKVDGGFEVETATHGILKSRAAILATGVTPLTLEAPGARELLGYGLGYSTTTHAHLASDKTVAVIGGTPRALRGAHELARIAKQVYLVVESAESLTTPLGIAVHYYPNVEVFEGYRVVEVQGAFQVEALLVAREEQIQRLEVDAAFVDLGLRPNSACVAHLFLTDRNGFVQVDDDGATAVSGLFAAGDVTTAFGEQLLIAVGQGARAAVSAYDYLLAHSSFHAHK
jgi:thioredoxin reductase (NADPH)